MVKLVVRFVCSLAYLLTTVKMGILDLILDQVN